MDRSKVCRNSTPKHPIQDCALPVARKYDVILANTNPVAQVIGPISQVVRNAIVTRPDGKPGVGVQLQGKRGNLQA